MNNCSYNLRRANPKYQHLVDQITSTLGMRRIEVYASDTDNACATLRRATNSGSLKPIIAYNPTFINELLDYSEWAVIGVFAHEVGHHFNLDIRGSFMNRRLVNRTSHRKELNADKFAGWILKRFGATLDEALHLYRIFEINQSFTHPAKSNRVNAMRQGWYEAHYQLNPPRRVTKHRQTSNIGEAILGIGAVVLFGLGIAAIAK